MLSIYLSQSLDFIKSRDHILDKNQSTTSKTTLQKRLNSDNSNSNIHSQTNAAEVFNLFQL